jgi:plastocyanin
MLASLVMGVVMAVSMDGGMMRRGNSAPQTPVTASGNVAVEIRDFDYSPRELTIPAGSSVTWTNHDGAPHTSTDEDESWDTGRLGEDESGTITFDTPGSYEYYCTYHPYMQASLTVR